MGGWDLSILNTQLIYENYNIKYTAGVIHNVNLRYNYLQNIYSFILVYIRTYIRHKIVEIVSSHVLRALLYPLHNRVALQRDNDF